MQYEKCSRKFYYKYLENIPEPETAETVRGTIFHKVLQDFYMVIDVKSYSKLHWDDIASSFEKILEQLFETEWAKIGADYNDVFADKKEEFYKETKEFLKFYAFKEAFRLHEIFKQNNIDDRWFNENIARGFFPKDREMFIDIEEMHGYVDKTINIFGRGVGIVDYKTSKSPLPHYIDSSHLLQLKAYAYLLKRKTGQLPYHVSIYYARTGESVYYEISNKDVDEVASLVKEIKSLNRNITSFPQKPTKLCNYCFYKDICRPDLSNL